MRIQHPRATDAFARDPPSQVAVPISSSRHTNVSVDDEGYLSIKPDKADDVMAYLASSYDVEYDRDTGDVVSHAGDDLEEAADDDETDSDQDGSDADTETDSDGDSDTDDLEAWADWNRDDWLALGWDDRKADVEDGLVDDHLTEIHDLESNHSKRVRNAAKARLEDLGRADELEDE
ncbi:hypothetical protein C482_15326 [Natrialba chahannaoensis JCM 10990]|uniref:Uncharacterized protein n=1 Tax=Natrialba chahannaoensis JCM 10990 TaxID=1227492 RepID=M0AHA0_9EURY|nr:hypothetical protein [Natrialba chahannaoensis]ELY96758.1 hypothetical protein C482_15326 [Natrialba chahannaoensis JCM 10990]